MFFCVNGPQSISSWRYQYMELSWCWKFPFSVMLGVIVCKTPQGMFLAVGWQPLTFLALGNSRLGSCSHVVWGWAVGAAWVTLEVADPPQTPATSGTGCARAGEIMEDVWMFLLKAAAGDEGNQHTQNVGPQTPQIPNLKWTEWKKAFISHIPARGCCFPRCSLFPSDNSLPAWRIRSHSPREGCKDSFFWGVLIMFVLIASNEDGSQCCELKKKKEVGTWKVKS